MPSFDALCRAPLLKPAFIALPPAQVKVEGELQGLIDRIVTAVDQGESCLDQTLLGALTGAPLPASPMLENAEMCLNTEPRKYLQSAIAAMLIAVRKRDKDAMLSVLDSVSTMADAIPALSHGQKIQNGADMLRLTNELYRRTGQRFLLDIMETLRAQLPDAAGFFHTFPLVRPYVPEENAANEDQATYQRHMRRMAKGRNLADELSVTALLSQYSGSAREQSAASVGITALNRYHGSPSGMFLSSPYLAGRDPSQPVELRATCHMLLALYDCVLTSGELSLMDQMERILFSALSPAFLPEGVRFMQPVSCLQGAEKTEKYPLSDRKTSATIKGGELSAPERTQLLRALYAARSMAWVASGESALCLMCPVDSVVTTHVGKSPVRITVTGGYPYHGKIKLTVEVKQPTLFSLSLRVPAYANGATVQLTGGEAIPAAAGKLYTVKREYHNGDEITLTIPLEPRLEEGYRGADSVLVGSIMMALPAPDKKVGWQYGLGPDCRLTFDEERFTVTAQAVALPEWTQRGGYPAPPPQGLRGAARCEITLVPACQTTSRIALFPRVEG